MIQTHTHTHTHTHTLAAYVSCQSALMGEYNSPLKVPVSCAELVALLHDSSHSCTARTPSPGASLYIITGDDVVSSGTSCAHSWHCRHSRNTSGFYFFLLDRCKSGVIFFFFFFYVLHMANILSLKGYISGNSAARGTISAKPFVALEEAAVG